MLDGEIPFINVFNHYHFIFPHSMIIIIMTSLSNQSLHFILLVTMIDNDRCATLLERLSEKHCHSAHPERWY